MTHRPAIPALALLLQLATPGEAQRSVPRPPAVPGPRTAPVAQLTTPVDPSLLKGLKYRMVGPGRGGRVTTVTGVASQPLTFYMGSTGGGVWKTTDAGQNWVNVSDAFFAVG